MKYTLMHKSIEVLIMQIDEPTGNIQSINELLSVEHLPIGVFSVDGIIDRTMLNTWWIERCIPSSRHHIQSILQELNISSPQTLLVKCYGLSLSDQYWVKPFGMDLKWENINFFQNDFSEDIGNILVGNRKVSKRMCLMSPDNTSEGNLRKRWKIMQGERFLLKSGSGAFQQEVFNEKIASKLMDLLKIQHVDYDIYWDNGIPFCFCKDFITTDEDLVSAWRFLELSEKTNDTSFYQHIINLGLKYGIKNIQRRMDEMLVLDYIILNEDRHYRNFGFIRDANTLEFKGFAPIFDSGSSLGFETPTQFLETFQPKWKPFVTKRIKTQLDLISDFSWIDFDALKEAKQIILGVYKESRGYIDETRASSIASRVEKRIEELRVYANHK